MGAILNFTAELEADSADPGVVIGCAIAWGVVLVAFAALWLYLRRGRR